MIHKFATICEFGVPRFAPSGPSGCISIYLVLSVDAGFPVYWLIGIGSVCYVARLGCKMVEIFDDAGMLEFPTYPTEFLWILEGSWEFSFKIKVPFSTSIALAGSLSTADCGLQIQDPWMELLKREAYDDTLILLGEANPRHLPGSLGF